MNPNGMLVDGDREVSRLLVANYSYGSQIVLLRVSSDGQRTDAMTDLARNLPDLLVSDAQDWDQDDRSKRCLVMAKRLVAGLLINLQHPPNFKVRKVAARAKTKGREAEPEHRIVQVGKPIEVDCRASVREYVERGPRRGKNSPPTVQVLVRGHYKRQVHGVGRLQRKEIWVQPYWRGPEAALIQTRGAKVSS